jgi:hypothetical protein
VLCGQQLRGRQQQRLTACEHKTKHRRAEQAVRLAKHKSSRVCKCKVACEQLHTRGRRASGSLSAMKLRVAMCCVAAAQWGPAAPPGSLAAQNMQSGSNQAWEYQWQDQ